MSAYSIALLVLLLGLVQNADAQVRTATPGARVESVLERQEVRRQTLQEQRASREAELKERIETRRAQLKARLTLIRDERKQKIVERLDEKIDEMNVRRVNHFNEVLERLRAIVTRLEAAVTNAKSEGKDTAAADAAIAAATSAIADAQTAVDAQGTKEYTPEIVDDETLRVMVGATVSQLRADLKSVFNAVKKAKDAVYTALRTVRTLQVEIPLSNDGSRNSATAAATQ